MQSTLPSVWHTVDPVKVKVHVLTFCVVGHQVWALLKATLWTVGKRMEAFGNPWVTLRIAQAFHCRLFFPRAHAEKAQYSAPWQLRMRDSQGHRAAGGCWKWGSFPPETGIFTLN